MPSPGSASDMLPRVAPTPRWGRLLFPALITLVVAYGASCVSIRLFRAYGPFDHPGWLVREQTVGALRDPLVPRGWTWKKVERPYVGGDPIGYLKFARGMRHFYQGHFREPVFLATTRMYLSATDDQDVAISLASLSFSVACVFATYLLGSTLGSRWAGLFAAIAVAVEHEIVTWAPDGWRDEAFATFVLLSAAAFLRLQRRWTGLSAVLVGICRRGSLSHAIELAHVSRASGLVAGLAARVRTLAHADRASRPGPRCDDRPRLSVPDQLLPRNGRSVHRRQPAHGVLSAPWTSPGHRHGHPAECAGLHDGAVCTKADRDGGYRAQGSFRHPIRDEVARLHRCAPARRAGVAVAGRGRTRRLAHNTEWPSGARDPHHVARALHAHLVVAWRGSLAVHDARLPLLPGCRVHLRRRAQPRFARSSATARAARSRACRCGEPSWAVALWC